MIKVNVGGKCNIHQYYLPPYINMFVENVHVAIKNISLHVIHK